MNHTFTVFGPTDSGCSCGQKWPCPTLDAAWAAAEAALPEGWELTNLTNVANPGPEWCAIAGSTADYAEADGPTPAAALRALAEKLLEVKR